MAKEVGRIEVVGRITGEKTEKAADTFASRISKRLEQHLKSLDVFKPVKGAGDAGEKDTGESANIATGVVAGLAAGGVIKVLDLVVEFIQSFGPILTVFKLLKAVITLLFLPLLPFWVLIIKGIAGLIPIMTPIFKTAKDGIEYLTSGGLLKDLGWLWDEGTAALGIVISGLWGKMVDWIKGAGLDALKGLGSYLWGLIVAGWDAIKFVGQWIFDNIIVPAWNGLLAVGQWIFDNIIYPGWQVIATVGSWLWDNIIVPGWDYLKDIGSKIWNTIISVWDWNLDIAAKMWDWIKNTWAWGLDIGANLWDWIKEKLGIGVKGTTGTGTAVTDAIITPTGTVYTSPNDYIIATKNPGGMGGSKTININIDRPVVRSDDDIKKLVRMIQLELYKENRRYNSYV